MPTKSKKCMPTISLIDSHLISSHSTVREALQRLNRLSGSNMTLFVTDSHTSELMGSLTDGDIRRALTSGAGLDTEVGGIAHAECLCIRSDAERYDVGRKAVARGITLLPVLEGGCVKELIDMRDKYALLPLDAVLMAGGKGERLRPLTLATPKPLLKIGGRPIIDYNVEALRSYGVDDIFVTVNYLKEQIEHHFLHHPSLKNVVCVEEPDRLGTMGSLALVKDLKADNILVMNSDLFTTVDFARMYQHHIDTGADITIGAVPYNVSVPFAIIEQKDGFVQSLAEKPTYTYLANGGIYMLRREVAGLIVPGEYLDAPDLVTQVIERGGKVTSFPIEGTWIDIGSPDDFRTADSLMSARND